MDIQQQANEYAKGRLATIIERLIAEIYSDGFHAGYQIRSKEVDDVVVQKIAEAKAAVAKAEAEREAEERRLAKKKAEIERIAREKAEAEKREAERIALEEAEKRTEKERTAAEKKKAAKKKADNDKKDRKTKDVEFIDLKLPSGTLWAVDTIDYMNYREAIKKYHLPSIEQCEELVNECKLSVSYDGFKFMSTDGRTLILSSSESNSYGHRFLKFWVDYEEDLDKNAKYASFTGFDKVPDSVSVDYPSLFVGESIPVIIVKSKQ